MTLKLTVDSLESIDEPLRPLYVEKDGKFSLNVEGIEDTSALKGALQKERKEREAIARQAKAWEKLGKTPDEILELVQAAEAKAMSDAERKGEWDKLKNQLVDTHTKERQKDRESYQALEQKYRSNVIDRQAVADIAAEGGVPDLLLPHVQRFVRTDDDFNPIVVDASGTPRLDSNGNAMTIRDLVKEMRASEVYGRAFNGAGHSGSGTLPSNGSGGTPPQSKITRKADLKDRKARATFVETHGAQAYFSLPD